MADNDIRGTVLDSGGSPVTGAVVEVAPARQDATTTEDTVVRTVTDSNGDYVVNSHPFGDGTTKEWHVSAYYWDGAAWVNAESNPGVTADLPASVIPDSVVDNFETDDADPFGVYASNETLADYYSGATAAWSRGTTSPLVGGYSLEWSESAVKTAIWSHPGDGLNAYPSEGDLLSILLQSVPSAPGSEGTAPSVPLALTNVEDVTAPSGYAYDISNEFGIRIGIASYNSDGTRANYTNLTSGTSGSITTGDPYYIEIDPPTSGDNTITSTAYNWNGSVGAQVDSVSTNDSQLVGNVGIGWGDQRNPEFTGGPSGDPTVGDQMEIL